MSLLKRFLVFAAFLVQPAIGQPWSAFLDESRAIAWDDVLFEIPDYQNNCSTQPTLTADSIEAAADNTTAIQNALASCDATNNVVNIPSGTYYTEGWTYASQGKQVVRGAGPTQTIIKPTGVKGCGGNWSTVCMISSPAIFSGHSSLVPPSGTQQCLWTGGYTKGSTTITLSDCPNGTGPPVDKLLILDQANDAADTGGQYICDTSTDDGDCTNKGPGSGNVAGRTIAGVGYSQKQFVYTTGVTNNGDGTFTVNISPGVYFNNIRSGQTPGAYWTGFVQNVGLENVTLDLDDTTREGGGSWWGLAMYNCYECWVKNVRSLYGPRAHIILYQSAKSVVRDSYLFKSKTAGSQSYGVELAHVSNILVENNVFQQLTAPVMTGNASGSVVGYNMSINNIYESAATFMQASYYSHNAGSEMNLWEGNNFNGIWADGVTWGSSTNGTLFRNKVPGWQTGKTSATSPIIMNAKSRAFNAVGNVLGQPGYHNTYESYATSTTAGVNGGSMAHTSVYGLGWTNVGGCNTPPTCDPLVRPTLMRWGNYDTVNNGVRWDTTEASPGSVPYVGANFTGSYFSSLPQELPASLYYSARPSWWPVTKAWPPVGPDISSGNLGVCTGGTYAGAQATSGGHCAGGTLSTAWAGHANSIPAQDCYLGVMGGPPPMGLAASLVSMQGHVGRAERRLPAKLRLRARGPSGSFGGL